MSRSAHEATPTSKQRERKEQQQEEGVLTNCDVIFGSFELPEGNVDGDTTLTLGLQLVEHPCVLEGTLAEFGGFLWRALALETCRNSSS